MLEKVGMEHLVACGEKAETEGVWKNIHRERVQMFFQDPYALLSSRLTVVRIVGESLEI